MTDPPTQNLQLRKMRRLATSLLVLMVILYCTARTLEDGPGVWIWVKAFSEAAMVGALADWFAVTALFRHPLGIPIPHTAIVRKEKARIGQAVASFVRASFLTPAEVIRQWDRFKPLEHLVSRLAEPENAKASIQWIILRLPKLLGKADQKALARLGAAGLQKGVSGIPVSRMVTILLDGFLKSPGRRSLLAPLLGRVGESVAANRQWIMDEATRSTPPQKVKMFDILSKAAASAVSGKAVEKFAAELKAASENEEHPLYLKIEEALADFAVELREGGDRWQNLKGRILNDAETRQAIEEVLEKAIGLFVETTESMEGSDSLTSWGQSLSEAASKLQEDPRRLADLDRKVSEMIARFCARYGAGVEKLISNTVESWEADELINRLENQVGSDLQFIRINGTLIGGLVGVLLHGLGLLIWS